MAAEQPIKESMPAGYVVPKVWEPKELGGTWGKGNRATAGARHEEELKVGKHPIQLYSLGTPNGQKVTMMLEELVEAGGEEYDAWKIMITGEQFGSGFTAINPNSKIPAMVDHSASPPLRVFESGAILLYLAEKYGKFLPKDLAGRTECLSWLFWQVGGAPFIGGGFGHFYRYAPMNFEYPIDRYAMETKRQIDVLDKQLEGCDAMRGSEIMMADFATDPWGRDFICGSEITIADFATHPWVRCITTGYHAAEFLQMHTYKNVAAWCARIEARPACARGLRVNGFNSSDVPERHSAKDFE
ncbi:hypothetical protein FOA52_011729 [Chlamydomonas sp. UWO 241]|nr:hypothetical protein FOA52_011729 [Chlamydomonas sp. UWO 241]